MRNALVTLSALASTCLGAVNADLLVSTAWLAGHLRDDDLVVVHVAANRSGYESGHIPGARFLALSEIAVTRDGVANELPPVAELKAAFERLGVSDHSRVILYTEGSVLAATRAFFTLDYLGHARHALLDGGLEKWVKENRPVTQEVPAVAAGRLNPKPRPELVATTAEVQRQVAAPAPSVTLLDVRTAREFREGGHIPTSRNAAWGDSLVPGGSVLQSEDALRKLYESAGLKPGNTVVTYCNSGMQASQSYFTLKYLGYDVRMYDGSLGEWTKTPGTILEK
jgi:thiosulfate/3-mercaptopyruvate sulfurtransferase